MQRHVATIAEYLECLEADQLEIINMLRGLIKQAAPRVREGIKWGMLQYAQDGDLFALAAQKQYVSLYMSTHVGRDRGRSTTLRAAQAGAEEGQRQIREAIAARHRPLLHDAPRREFRRTHEHSPEHRQPTL